MLSRVAAGAMSLNQATLVHKFGTVAGRNSRSYHFSFVEVLMQATGSKARQTDIQHSAHELLWRHARLMMQAEPDVLPLIISHLLKNACEHAGTHGIELHLPPAHHQLFNTESFVGQTAAAHDYISGTSSLQLANSQATLQLKYVDNPTEATQEFVRHLAELLDTVLTTSLQTAESRQQQRRDKTLIRELHHRTKNNLQVVSSLLDLQGLRSGSPLLESNLSAAAMRVRTIAIVHETMCQTESGEHMNLHSFAIELISALTSLFCLDGKQPSIQVNVAELPLSIERATPCALILNELLCNSFKHAFPNKQGGTIVVEALSNNKNIHIRVADDGVGLPDATANQPREGFGFTIIRELADQIDADLTFDFTQGFECRFHFVDPADK